MAEQTRRLHLEKIKFISVYYAHKSAAYIYTTEQGQTSVMGEG